MDLGTIIKEKSVTYCLAAIVGVMGYFFGLVFDHLISPFLSTILSQVTITALWSLLGLSLVCFVLFALITIPYIFYLRSKLKINPEEYEYFQDPGIAKHKKTKELFCGKCLDEGKRHRLSFHFEKGVICRHCNESYVSPLDYESSWKQSILGDKS